MHLARVSNGREEFWCRREETGNSVRRIGASFRDWAPAITSGGGLDDLQLTGSPLATDELRFLPPFDPQARVVVAGANYSKHLTEFGVPQVQSPFAFLKANGALIGAHDDIRYPPLTEKLDYEVELVAVIGTDRVNLNNPYKSVLGWTVGNDVSARDLQRSGPKGIGMDLFAAKSQDRSTPVGPWIVTRDEFPVDATPVCRMMTRVNGEIRQDASTGDMTFKVDEIIRFVQQRSSFGIGDLLFTGTPDGVADGSGKFLKPGDVVEAEIEGVGLLRNTVSKD